MNTRALLNASSLVALLAGGVAALTAAPAAYGTVVYDTTQAAVGGTQYVIQQNGVGDYYVGDTATIAPTTSTLTTIAIPFLTSAYDTTTNQLTPFDYTPNVTLDLYASAANAATGTGKLGSAVVNNVLFHNDGKLDPTYHYNDEDEQTLTFDFSGQNILLPTTFAFAYHDDPPVGSDPEGAADFSVVLTGAATASPGVASPGAFETYPNTAPTLLAPNDIIFDTYAPADPLAGTLAQTQVNIQAQISVVPEPASLSIGAVGGAALLARRRRTAR